MYDTNQILYDLDMSQDTFNDIAILSGTDYNLNEYKSLSDTVRLYMKFREWSNLNISKRNINSVTFYEWLIENTNYISNIDSLQHVRQMFDLSVYLEKNREEIKQIIDFVPFKLKDVDFEKLKDVLYDDGFIFA